MRSVVVVVVVVVVMRKEGRCRLRRCGEDCGESVQSRLVKVSELMRSRGELLVIIKETRCRPAYIPRDKSG
jgi:hypothetical protein